MRSMRAPEAPRRARVWRITGLFGLIGLLLGSGVGPAQAQFVPFESGMVRGLALDGGRLYAVNTPDNRLEVYDVESDGGLLHRHSVVVGLEPVAVAVFGSQAWVVNHLSDSVSIGDVVKFRLGELESEASDLKNYIAGA